MDMDPCNYSDSEDESERDTENLFNENGDLLEIISNMKSTFNYSLQFREEKNEDKEEYNKLSWECHTRRYKLS